MDLIDFAAHDVLGEKLRDAGLDQDVKKEIMDSYLEWEEKKLKC